MNAGKKGGVMKAKYMEEKESMSKKQNLKTNKLNFYIAFCQTHKVLLGKHQ